MSEEQMDPKEKERAAYWANKGKKKGREVTRLMCSTCKGMPGTRSWTGGQFQWVGDGPQRRLIHVGCPGPRELPKPPLQVPEPPKQDQGVIDAALAMGLSVLMRGKEAVGIIAPEKKENPT